MKVDEIVQPYDQRSNETVSLRNQVIKYRNLQKWMVEFLKNIENRSIKIARVNSILIIKSTNLRLFTLILYSVGDRWDDVFKLTASA